MGALEGKTVLVVDDEEELRELVCWEIQHQGGATLEANCGAKAFETLQKHQVDAVVTDIRMPNGDGVELLEQIRSRHPEVPVVILISGHSDTSPSDLFAKGAEGYLVKPFTLNLLVSKLSSLLQPRAERWKRQHPRVDVEQEIEIRVESELGKADVVNIGRGGMFVASPQALPRIGERISFKLTIIKPHLVQIEGAGVVRWIRSKTASQRPGYGVEFTELSDSSLEYLIGAIESSLGISFIPEK